MTHVELTSNGAKRRRTRGENRMSKPLSKDFRRAALTRYDRIVSGLVTALGSDLTIEQRVLIEAFAGIALKIKDANARLLVGENVNLTEHATAVATLVQLAQSIGVVRHEVCKDIALGDALLLKVASTKQAEA
jgi:hypothetical protein